jgi:hypothetical protein
MYKIMTLITFFFLYLNKWKNVTDLENILGLKYLNKIK